MSELALPNLVIDNFRLFEHLEIERLGRLNLITGANGSGKTCLLEAVELWANDGSFWTVLEQSRRREAPIAVPSRLDAPPGAVRDAVAATCAVFHRWPSAELQPSLRIEAGGVPLTAMVSWADPQTRPTDAISASVPTWSAQAPHVRSFQRLDHAPSRTVESREKASQLVPASGLRASDLAGLWDLVGTSEAGLEVERALDSISPGIERINFVETAFETGVRVPVAKVRGTPHAISLRTLGDGVTRFLAMGLAVVRAEGGVVLIDEFENGLHRTVQRQVWELVLTLARDLDVQVFATTHSVDCVHTFAEIASHEPAGDLALHRLDTVSDRPRVVSFHGEDMPVILDHGLEVR